MLQILNLFLIIMWEKIDIIILHKLIIIIKKMRIKINTKIKIMLKKKNLYKQEDMLGEDSKHHQVLPMLWIIIKIIMLILIIII